MVQMVETEPKKNYFIYFAVLSTTWVAFSVASCYTWTSPVLIKLGTSDPTSNPIGTIITTFESTWIVSALNVGLICGPPLAIFFSSFLLKKTILLIGAAPITVAHIIFIFACEVMHFILARFLMGLGCGIILPILGSFIAEISEDKNRGILGSFFGVLSNLGNLFIYSVGPFVTIRSFSILNLIPLALFYVFFGFFVPNSPYDLVKTNKNKEAEKSLIRLRRVSKVEKELAFILKTIEPSASSNVKVSKLLSNKGIRKALLICMVLMACQPLAGVLVVGNYTQTIFELADGAVSSAVSAIIIGAVSAVSTIISSQLTDRLGRKLLMSTSCISTSLSLFVLGGYFYLLDNGNDVSMISWLPLVSLIILMIGYNFGLVVLPWVIMGEILPSSAKTVTSTIAALINFILLFIVTLSFPYIADSIGIAWTFWIFFGMMVLGSIFSLVYLPETKGKDFQEILNMLEA